MESKDLKDWRENLGITQADLALKLGVATNTVSRWELGSRKIPTHLHLALSLLRSGASYPIVRMNYDQEAEAFTLQNLGFAKHLPNLVEAIDKTLVQVKVKGGRNPDLAVNMLCRICVRHYESLLLLLMSGHGYSAGRILRSLFEKYVDAIYLAKFPAEAEDFWDYALFTLMEERGESFVRNYEPDYKKKMARFYTGRRKTPRPRWSRLDLRKKADMIPIDPWFSQHAYKELHLYVHSSMKEIVDSLIEEEDGSISPVSGSSEQERRVGGVYLILATHILRNVLVLLISHFDLEKPAHFTDFFSEFDAWFSG